MQCLPLLFDKKIFSPDDDQEGSKHVLSDSKRIIECSLVNVVFMSTATTWCILLK
jgi:hypothetical protein